MVTQHNYPVRENDTVASSMQNTRHLSVNSDYASPQVVAWKDDWAQFNGRQNAGILPSGLFFIRQVKNNGGQQHNLNSEIIQK